MFGEHFKTAQALVVYPAVLDSHLVVAAANKDRNTCTYTGRTNDYRTESQYHLRNLQSKLRVVELMHNMCQIMQHQLQMVTRLKYVGVCLGMCMFVCGCGCLAVLYMWVCVC